MDATKLQRIMESIKAGHYNPDATLEGQFAISETAERIATFLRESTSSRWPPLRGGVARADGTDSH